VVIGLVGGLALGAALGLVVGLFLRGERTARATARAESAEARLDQAVADGERLRAERDEATSRAVALDLERTRLAEQLTGEVRLAEERAAAWEASTRQLTGEFSRLSSAALAANNEQFLTLADRRIKEAQEAAAGELARKHQAIEQLVGPLREQLGRYEEGVVSLERHRADAYRGLTEQVQALGLSQEQLQRETRNLATALRSPSARGRWGELQLRKVVEMAGMVEHCDFDLQVTADGDEGRQRPDLVAHLPGGKQVVVDAKVPLEAFQAAVDAEDEGERRNHLAAHARQVRTHVEALAKKAYWKQFDPSPEFVVAFIPGDPLLAAAFEQDPGLLEFAVANHVLLATPVTLISLLRAVSYGWQQEAMADNARAVQELGRQLYDRLVTFGAHLNKVGKSLNMAVGAYNDAVGSMESRVLVSARRFPELGVTGEKELAGLEQVLARTRDMQAPELLPAANGLPVVVEHVERPSLWAVPEGSAAESGEATASDQLAE